MKNLRLTLVTIALLTAPFLSQAQEGKQKKDRYDNLKTKLELNDEQVTKLKAIDEKYEAKRKELKNKIEPLQKELKTLKEEKKANKKAQGEEVEQVLTPEQVEKFKELRRTQMEKKRRKELKEN